MKKRIDVKSLMLGTLLGVSVMLSVAALPPGSRNQWEYKQLWAHQSDAQLNDHAKEGWVVDQVEKGREGNSRWDYYLLKRPGREF